MSEQPHPQPRRHPAEHLARWSWPKGVSGNPGGSPSKAEREVLLRGKVAELAEPFGGLSALDAINRERLDQVARLLLDTRRRSATDTVRYAHIVERLLAAVEAGASRRGTRSIGG
jgi:BMFP domain-containing protein YqiC